MKDLIVRIIGENRVKAGLDSAKGDIQKFSDAGKTFVKSLKDELSSIANNIPGLGALTKSFGGVFAAAVGGAIAVGKALQNAIRDSAAAWKDFGSRIDADFVRFSKQALEFNKNFTKARETGSVETAVELRVNTEKAREELLGEIRKLQAEIDSPGFAVQFGKIINAIAPGDEPGGGAAGSEYGNKVRELQFKQNDLARLDREILSAKKLELDNGVKAANAQSEAALKQAAEFTKKQAEIRAQFDRAGRDVADRDTLQNGTDPEKLAIATRMRDEGLDQLQKLQKVLFPTEEDISARASATEQVIKASDIIEEIRRKIPDALPGDSKSIEDPEFRAAQDARDAEGKKALQMLKERVREERISLLPVDKQIEARKAEYKGLQDKLFGADDLEKAEIGNKMADLRAEIRGLEEKSKAEKESKVTDAIEKEKLSRTFQNISTGDAFESLYGQRGNRDPAERTASASEKALEVLKNIEKKTGAAP